MIIRTWLTMALFRNSEQLPMECHKEMDDNIKENNIENVPREFATSTTDSLKR